MKFIRTLIIAAASAVLVACGGHGFEGEYKIASASEDDILGSLAEQFASDTVIVIGADFVDTNGKRESYDKIIVRESGTKRYLVLIRQDQEQAWEIIDNDTLVQGSGFLKMTLKRIKS
ncbi:hypothetical protein QWY77_13960 [Thalassotalea ponticola]|uniref:hypothetical protein n=1 Tax=Thalassotalea ponticola TaxID=1523392 RepID=UPI0025B5789D|nr:hypothetical protein [Thalassotalea ponticola]MDN3653845.1 hypothetical protein [Thalassotalea ponticola]